MARTQAWVGPKELAFQARRLRDWLVSRRVVGLERSFGPGSKGIACRHSELVQRLQLTTSAKVALPGHLVEPSALKCR